MAPPLGPPVNPCELHCRPSNEYFAEKLRDAVVDGTPCHQGQASRDLCINGICKVCLDKKRVSQHRLSSAPWWSSSGSSWPSFGHPSQAVPLVLPTLLVEPLVGHLSAQTPPLLLALEPAQLVLTPPASASAGGLPPSSLPLASPCMLACRHSPSQKPESRLWLDLLLVG